MYHGILNVYKPAGYTSFDVVAKLRGILKQKKIGHTGTLDPEATGVLAVCLGTATKVCDLLTDRDKTYETVLRLGQISDTQDAFGAVLEERAVPAYSKEEIAAAADAFRGEILQIPPMYSALKVDGKRLYELAREGKTIERKARPVTVHEIDVTAVDLPRISMRIRCSKGTYIRTICHDLGAALGCGALMESLVRTQAAGFGIEDALMLEEIVQLSAAGRLNERIVPVDAVFAAYPALVVKPGCDKALLNGAKLYAGAFDPVKSADGLKEAQRKCEDKTAEQLFRVYTSGSTFAAIYRQTEDSFRVEKYFYSQGQV